MSDAAARAVESEVELLRNLSHPQIIRFHETIRTEHHLYLVFEYVENGTLRSLQGGPVRTDSSLSDSQL